MTTLVTTLTKHVVCRGCVVTLVRQQARRTCGIACCQATVAVWRADTEANTCPASRPLGEHATRHGRVAPSGNRIMASGSEWRPKDQARRRKLTPWLAQGLRSARAAGLRTRRVKRVEPTKIDCDCRLPEARDDQANLRRLGGGHGLSPWCVASLRRWVENGRPRGPARREGCDCHRAFYAVRRARRSVRCTRSASVSCQLGGSPRQGIPQGLEPCVEESGLKMGENCIVPNNTMWRWGATGHGRWNPCRGSIWRIAEPFTKSGCGNISCSSPAHLQGAWHGASSFSCL